MSTRGLDQRDVSPCSLAIPLGMFVVRRYVSVSSIYRRGRLLPIAISNFARAGIAVLDSGSSMCVRNYGLRFAVRWEIGK